MPLCHCRFLSATPPFFPKLGRSSVVHLLSGFFFWIFTPPPTSVFSYVFYEEPPPCLDQGFRRVLFTYQRLILFFVAVEPCVFFFLFFSSFFGFFSVHVPPCTLLHLRDPTSPFRSLFFARPPFRFGSRFITLFFLLGIFLISFSSFPVLLLLAP